jgi:hypothetical protein
MSVPQGSPLVEMTGVAKTPSWRKRAVGVCTAFLLALAFAVAGASAAQAGPMCPDKPGVCPPYEWVH